MWLYCHRRHNYDDRARRQSLEFTPGAVYEVEDALASLLSRAHPDRICALPDAKNEEQALAHRCKVGRAIAHTKTPQYETTVVEEPDTDRMMRPKMSAGRRKAYRDMLKRSGKARRTVANA